MDDKQATIVAAKATKIQAVAAAMTLFVTLGLVYLSKLQTQTMQTQINLNLYEKRFKIYKSLIILIDSVLCVTLPSNITETQRFVEEISGYLQVFWSDSREKTFLVDDELNEYISSVDDELNEYISSVDDELNEYISSIENKIKDLVQIVTTILLHHLVLSMDPGLQK